MKLRWNWILIAAIVWIGGLVGIGIEGYLKPRGRTVFDIYSIASRQWVAGEEMYDRQKETNELYRYSPAFAVLTIPFAELPPGSGNAAWKITNAAVFLAGLLVWTRHCLPESYTADLTGKLFLLAIPTAMLSFHIGQANLLMTGLILLGASAAIRDRWWIAAAMVAAAVYVKVFPIAFAGILCVLYPKRFLPRFIAALAVGAIFPFAAQEPSYVIQEYRSWFHHVAESGEINRERLRSLSRFLDVCGLPLEPREFMLLGAAAGVIVLLVCIRYAAKADRRETLFRATAWFLVWSLMFSPSTEFVTYSIIAPISAWAVVEAFRKKGAWAERIFATASLWLMGPAGTDATPKALSEFCERNALESVGVLMLTAILLIDLIRPRVKERLVDSTPSQSSQ